jgi:hypothetical protein
MRFGSEKKWYLEIGRVPWKDCLVHITFAAGFIPDAELGVIPWRTYRTWSSDRLPHLLWRNWRPYGFYAFGRRRIWRS